MALVFHADGSIDFLAEDGSTAKQTIAAGTPEITWMPQYIVFQAAHPGPPVPSSPPEIVVLPQADPGTTGAAFVLNNTLMISRGSAVAIQIGATGATGPGGVLI